MKPELKQRLLFGGASIAVLIVLLTLAPYPTFKPLFTLAIASIAAFGLYEMTRFFAAKGIRLKMPLLLIISTALCFTFLLNSYVPLARPFAVIFLPLVIVAASLLSAEGSLERAAASLFCILYVAVPMAFMVDIVYGTWSPITGRYWLVFLVATTKLTDVGAFFSGRFLGRRKLCPSISPNKTQEGAFGGLVVALACGAFFGWYAQENNISFLTITGSAILGFFIGVFAIVGDLLESLFKRDAKIKDSGTLLPGLGGMLDLIDSLLLTTPLVWAAMYL